MTLNKEDMKALTDKYAKMCGENDTVEQNLFAEYGVKRGLRDINGKGVLTGITNISRVESTQIIDGKSVPCPGRLFYRGYNIKDLVNGFISEDRFGFEETAYLLLFGKLPKKDEIEDFSKMLSAQRKLPTNFVRDVIMKAPSADIMNSLTKSILTLASYDKNASDTSVENVIQQSVKLISTFPMMAVYGYHAYNHYEKDESMYIHRPDENLSTAENILRMLRPDKNYTALEAGFPAHLEAKVLDLALVLHMEHGGGNNSTFTTRVVTSSGSDTYATIAAALCSLKGPRHGGANVKVVDMFQDIKHNCKHYDDEHEIKEYLRKILNKEAFDKKGLIYGMGHAVYSVSDPRAEVFKRFVEQLAEEKHRQKDFKLYSMIERLAPEVIGEERHIYKGVSANVDFYSGLVYSMLDIPKELYTPIFAIARIVGWSAHRIEEIINADKIMRPAYVSNCAFNDYIEVEDR